MKSFILAALFSASAFTCFAQSGTVTTIAGTGSGSFSGDGGAATAAAVYNASGIAVAPDGTIYIADRGNNRIRKISTSGTISTVAGYGTGAGYGGDGGPATAADMRFPTNVALDAAGNIYFADAGNHCIRKVNTSGIISTVAGNGSSGYSGDGGPATAATMLHPWDVKVDAAGNIYIADKDNHAIRKVNTSGVISTIAGNGTSGFGGDGGPATAASLYYPTGLFIDRSNNVYIADYFNDRIRKINTSGIISTVAGNGTTSYSGDGGPATAAGMYSPNSLTIDSVGNMYIADELNERVRKVSPSGIIITVAGDGSTGFLADGSPATSGGMDAPVGVCVDNSGNLLFCDFNNNRIRKVSCPVLPTVSVTGITSACIGTSFSMVGSPAGGTWHTSSSGLATITATGLVTALGAGSPVMSYSYTNSCGTATDTQAISILPPTSATISGPHNVCQGGTIALTAVTAGGTWSSSAPGVATIYSSGGITGISVGSATITYNVSGTCGDDSATYSITVNPLPNAGSISGSATVCEGSTTTLASSATGGTWYSSSPTVASVAAGVITGVAAGSATISYVVTNSCGTDAATRPFTVYALTAAGNISGPASVCENNTINLTDPIAGGTWASSNNALATVSGGVVTGVAAGSVTISYSVTSTCGTATTTHNTTVVPIGSCTVNVENTEDAEKRLLAYPNPNTGSFTVTLPIAVNSATICITDVYGKVIVQRVIAGTKAIKEHFRLNTAAGNYFIKVVTTDAVYTGKVIVE